MNEPGRNGRLTVPRAVVASVAVLLALAAFPNWAPVTGKEQVVPADPRPLSLTATDLPAGKSSDFLAPACRDHSPPTDRNGFDECRTHPTRERGDPARNQQIDLGGHDRQPLGSARSPASVARS